MPIMFSSATPVPGMFDTVTSTTCLGVLDQITDLIPIVLPAVIGFIAFRKGWKFIKSALMGA